MLLAVMPTTSRLSPRWPGGSRRCRHNADVGIIVLKPISA